VLTIGSFSLMTGLSIAALRHYDEVGVLQPAEVDPSTGYRRYDLAQVSAGRTLSLLRALGVPVDGLRRASTGGVIPVLREHRDRIQRAAEDTAATLTTIDHYLQKGLPMATTRISQVTIVTDDLEKSVAFYRDAFEAEYHPEISSFQFGEFPDDDFFLLTVANPRRHPWPGGPVKFGLTVDDIDATHARAVAAGAVEIQAPVDRPWKPRSSTVQDPAGNHIDLYATGA
jgi:predicted enzyme related to lactoylglutathione lyase